MNRFQAERSSCSAEVASLSVDGSVQVVPLSNSPKHVISAHLLHQTRLYAMPKVVDISTAAVFTIVFVSALFAILIVQKDSECKISLITFRAREVSPYNHQVLTQSLVRTCVTTPYGTPLAMATNFRKSAQAYQSSLSMMKRLPPRQRHPRHEGHSPVAFQQQHYDHPLQNT
jgi:hypothetical protein